MAQRFSKFVTATIPLIIMGIVLLASPASVQGQDEKEVVRNKIEALLKEVARLQDEGAADNVLSALPDLICGDFIRASLWSHVAERVPLRGGPPLM